MLLIRRPYMPVIADPLYSLCVAIILMPRLKFDILLHQKILFYDNLKQISASSEPK